MTTSAIPAEEREINLLLALRNTAEGLTAAEIIKRVSGYNPAGGGSARRMFERDKDILRQIGVPLRASGTGDQCRYRIEEEDYALAPLRLDAAQTAALDLAASAWRDGSLPVAARRALTKLRAVSPGSEAGAAPDLSVDLAGQEVPARLAAAVDERRVVAFDYASASSGSLRRRVVEPHALRLSEGAWYLDGLDTRAGESRTFRLARVHGEIEVIGDPGAFEAPEPENPPPLVAVLAVAAGRALELRLRALETAEEPTAHRPEPGMDVIAVPYADPFSFAGALAALGDAVVVLEPAQLREEVLAHLRGAAALDDAEPDKTAVSDKTAVPGEASSGGVAPDDAAPDGAPPNGAAPGEAALNGAALNGGGR